MRFLTAAALRRPTVTILAVILILVSGVSAYRALQVELFPELEFPFVAIYASYPSAAPDSVVRFVTEPIERAISDTPELESLQSTSREGSSTISVGFPYGTDMDSAQAAIESALSTLSFPEGVSEPNVVRFEANAFPVISFSVISDRPAQEVEAIVRSGILPEIQGIAGVREVRLVGATDRNVRVTVDAEKMAAAGVSMFEVSGALSGNNFALPAGLLFDGSQALLVKTSSTLESVEDIENLKVGPVRLSDVATVTLGEWVANSISRTNGKLGIGVEVVKAAEANTVDVTSAVNDILEGAVFPADVEAVIIDDQGPRIQHQIDTLVQEAMFGFLFAISVVFAFMFTIRPTVVRGFFGTLRPTLVIGLSIPLSVFTGILLMYSQDMTLNFMTFGGLAISVGRVVDDSIVVLENVYRHIQSGRERWRAALEATAEVGPAIFASTMTTVVVFVPLAFISGIVGAFFLPFALTVTFALIASLLVALTAVPVLSAYLLRPGDLPEGAGDEGEVELPETGLQRVYMAILGWALRHRLVTLLAALVLTVGSFGLIRVIPINLFGGETTAVQIELTMPPGSTQAQTLAEAISIEERVREYADVYVSSLGLNEFGGGVGAGRPDHADIYFTLRDDAPDNIAEILREDLAKPGYLIGISEIVSGPPSGGVEIEITGSDYEDIAAVTLELTESLTDLEGIANLSNTITRARPEIAIEVDSDKAAAIGLTPQEVGFQLAQFLTGQTVTTLPVDGQQLDVIVSGDPSDAADLNGVSALIITGRVGSAPLADLADLSIRESAAEIRRTNGERSASITADITSDDTQAVGLEVDEKIAALAIPPGVTISSGGVFADIAEGFQQIFLAMGVGIVLVYLVMVASLGSLRNPFVIVTTLPLALIGVLAALLITGRSLGLPAAMGVLLLIGIVVTNAIVLIAFVEQQRARGMEVYEALISGARVRLRPILMTALTTSFALLPLAAASEGSGGLISAELATVVIGGLMSSTALTLVVLPIVYLIFNDSIPRLLGRLFHRSRPPAPVPEPTA